VIVLTCAVAGALGFIHNANAITLLLSGATAGFFVSYALPVVGAALTRLRGRWTPGVVSMGKAAATVTYFAAIWMVAEIINIAWPRTSLAPRGAPLYQLWAAPLVLAAIAILVVAAPWHPFCSNWINASMSPVPARSMTPRTGNGSLA
jgi:hypothetical protein